MQEIGLMEMFCMAGIAQSLMFDDGGLKVCPLSSYPSVCVLRVVRAGIEETVQPPKPSFLEYFEQKEKEANHHGGAGDADRNADNRKLPAESDMDMVSALSAARCTPYDVCPHLWTLYGFCALLQNTTVSI